MPLPHFSRSSHLFLSPDEIRVLLRAAEIVATTIPSIQQALKLPEPDPLALAELRREIYPGPLDSAMTKLIAAATEHGPISAA